MPRRGGRRGLGAGLGVGAHPPAEQRPRRRALAQHQRQILVEQQIRRGDDNRSQRDHAAVPSSGPEPLRPDIFEYRPPAASMIAAPSAATSTCIPFQLRTITVATQPAMTIPATTAAPTLLRMVAVISPPKVCRAVA